MTQTTNITAEFIWTFDEMQAMQEALAVMAVTPKASRSGFSWITYVLLPIAIVIMIMDNSTKYKLPSIATIKDNLPVIGMSVLLVLVLWTVFSYAQKHNLKQAFFQSPDYNKRIYVTFGPDEVVIASEASETKLKWIRFIEVRRTSKGFCFLQSPQAGLWIPIHAFKSTADVESLAELARRLTPKFTIN
ncbi:MAG TPA: YcxB family protein [Anaerolineales bacterium]|nr:YcxB family protein [Anaerolineales bacterium]